jgi:hypothetical protein
MVGEEEKNVNVVEMRDKEILSIKKNVDNAIKAGLSIKDVVVLSKDVENSEINPALLNRASVTIKNSHLFHIPFKHLVDNYGFDPEILHGVGTTSVGHELEHYNHHVLNQVGGNAEFVVVFGSRKDEDKDIKGNTIYLPMIKTITPLSKHSRKIAEEVTNAPTNLSKGDKKDATAKNIGKLHVEVNGEYVTFGDYLRELIKKETKDQEDK